MRLIVVAVAVSAAALGACAGRDPMPIATVQAQDQYATCLQIRAEVEANNAKVQQLADERGLKVAQNVGAGVVGLIIWPVWFGWISRMPERTWPHCRRASNILPRSLRNVHTQAPEPPPQRGRKPPAR